MIVNCTTVSYFHFTLLGILLKSLSNCIALGWLTGLPPHSGFLFSGGSSTDSVISPHTFTVQTPGFVAWGRSPQTTSQCLCNLWLMANVHEFIRRICMHISHLCPSIPTSSFLPKPSSPQLFYLPTSSIVLKLTSSSWSLTLPIPYPLPHRYPPTRFGPLCGCGGEYQWSVLASSN